MRPLGPGKVWNSTIVRDKSWGGVRKRNQKRKMQSATESM